MEIKEILCLIEESINTFEKKVQAILEEIIRTNSETKNIQELILKEELKKQLYTQTFSKLNLSKQIIVQTQEDKFMLETFELFLKDPGMKVVHKRFRVPYPPGRIIGEYLQKQPKLTIKSLVMEIFDTDLFKKQQAELVNIYHDFLDETYEIRIKAETRAKQILTGLMFMVIIKHLRQGLTDDLKQKYAKVFLNELKKKPLQTHYIAALSGIAINQTITLGGGITLKEYQEGDFDEIDEFAVLINQEEIQLPSSCILKMKWIGRNNEGLSSLEKSTLTAIRLFTFGEVYITYKVIFPERIIEMKKISKIKSSHKKPDYIWTLPENEQETLTKFAETIIPLFQNQLKENQHKAVQYALERFDWSLRDELGIERRLLFAIMGLEPLFLPETTLSGKAKKLSERMTKLLTEFGFEEAIVNKNVKRAYWYRNKIVHGSKYPQNWKKEIDKLYPKILNYLRVALIFFVLQIKKGRDAIIQSIIEALKSDQELKELQKITKKMYEQYKGAFIREHYKLL